MIFWSSDLPLFRFTIPRSKLQAWHPARAPDTSPLPFCPIPSLEATPPFPSSLSPPLTPLWFDFSPSCLLIRVFNALGSENAIAFVTLLVAFLWLFSTLRTVVYVCAPFWMRQPICSLDANHPFLSDSPLSPPSSQYMSCPAPPGWFHLQTEGERKTKFSSSVESLGPATNFQEKFGSFGVFVISSDRSSLLYGAL